MFPILQIGPFALQTPGLILLAGLWLGLSLAERGAAQNGLNADTLYNLTLVALIAGIVGARLAYVARFPSAFAESPLSLLSINPGLLDPFAGAVLAGITVLAYGQRKRLQLWPALDAFVPLLAVMGVALPLANLAAGRAFGAPTGVPWAIELWGAARHPVQLYEAVAAGAILWAFWPGKWIEKCAPGTKFLAFVSATTGARLFFEGFRGDSLTVPGGFRAMQLIAWVVLSVSLWTLSQRWTDRKEQETSS